MVRAWYMDDETSDQRLEHLTDPPQFLDLDTLRQLDIKYYQIDADNFSTDPTLAKIRKDNNYDYEDQVNLRKEIFPNYDEMLKRFFEEHIHSDDEIRLILDGRGYFDVRDPRNDKWVRIEVVKNDLIVIPAGIYHRFTLDTENYIKVNRYFCGNPVWIPLNRPQEGHPIRQAYVDKFQQG